MRKSKVGSDDFCGIDKGPSMAVVSISNKQLLKISKNQQQKRHPMVFQHHEEKTMKDQSQIMLNGIMVPCTLTSNRLNPRTRAHRTSQTTQKKFNQTTLFLKHI